MICIVDRVIKCNKNGTFDGYSFNPDNYNNGKCGKGSSLKGDIPQGNATYDAATANIDINTPWKMPTYNQVYDMTLNTTNEWTTINGVNGWKFINKSNSNKYIFLPVGGYWYNTTHEGVSYGHYWCVTYDTQYYAMYISLDSNQVFISSTGRSLGLLTRGIK